MHETWLKAYEEGKSSLVALFDLSATFDTLNKDIFCSKLSAYGFDEVSVSWFESYLSGRSQIVIVGASMSQECQLTVGSTLHREPFSQQVFL